MSNKKDGRGPLVVLEDLDLYYESKRGLFKEPFRVGAAVDINLSINSGEVLAIVGESGCGKTTLGNVIIGMLKPTKGTIYFNGQDVYKMNKEAYKEFRSSVQLVQQDSYAALNPVKTLRSSLCGPILHKKIADNRKQAQEMVHEALDMVGISHEELDKYPHELSGGQRQRIIMARAILMKPKLIVADEPVSMIDVSLRISILNLMSKLNQELGIAFVYITHDFGTARYIARDGNIGIMYLGKIVEYGNVQDVLEHPAHPYLQALLTAVPIPDPTIAKKKTSLPLKSFDMPSVAAPPPGCRFNPRCPYATEICEKEEPVFTLHGSNYCACHNIDEIPDWSLRKDI
ncbi:MAG TPA: ABC transporter ATP-binding protein [Bacillota bacterium]|nr:ABC transporter ATP-binding protein [Bacillota bacterium]